MNKLSVSATCVALAAVCAALFFWNLGGVPLIGRDEGMYAETAREMIATGNYVLPTYNAQPFFDKPPLVYWLQAAGMRALGVEPLAARLPSALAAALLIALTVALGIRLYDRRSGILAGFALATALLTTSLARMAVMDQLFTLTITAALGAFALSLAGKLPGYGCLWFWACMGLAAMVKGPAGAVLILSAVIAFLVLRRQVREFARMMPLPGLIVFLAIAAPWYVLVQRASGGEFLREFIIHQNLQRALGMDFQHNMPFYSYLPIYLVGFFPWSVFVPTAWARLVRLRPRDAAGEVSLFAAVWMVTVLVIFSVSLSKLPAYIYPACPPSALLVGAMWSRATAKSLKRSGLVVLILAAAIAAALRMASSRLPDPIPGLENALAPMEVALVLGAGVSFILLLRGRVTGAFVALCAGMTAFLLVASLMGLPIAARRLSGPVLGVAREVRTLAAPGETVYAYEFWLVPQLVFYSRHTVRQLDTRPELDAVLARGRGCLVITRDGKATDLPPHAKLVSRSEPFSLYRITRPPPNPKSP